MFDIHYSSRHAGYVLTYDWMILDDQHMYVSLIINDSKWLEGYAKLMNRVDFVMRKRNNCRPFTQKQRYLNILSNHRKQVK